MHEVLSFFSFFVLNYISIVYIGWFGDAEDCPDTRRGLRNLHDFRA